MGTVRLVVVTELVQGHALCSFLCSSVAFFSLAPKAKSHTRCSHLDLLLSNGSPWTGHSAHLTGPGSSPVKIGVTTVSWDGELH